MREKLKADMLAAVEQMPEDWDETELAWYLVQRAGLLTPAPQGLRAHGQVPAIVTTAAVALAAATLSGLRLRPTGAQGRFRMESGPRHWTPPCPEVR